MSNAAPTVRLSMFHNTDTTRTNDYARLVLRLRLALPALRLCSVGLCGDFACSVVGAEFAERCFWDLDACGACDVLLSPFIVLLASPCTISSAPLASALNASAWSSMTLRAAANTSSPISLDPGSQSCQAPQSMQTTTLQPTMAPYSDTGFAASGCSSSAHGQLPAMCSSPQPSQPITAP